MLDDDALSSLAARIAAVPGVVGVALGGSRARGEHTPESDTDLGIYYREDLDVERLGVLAREVGGPDATVTVRGGWGPWVDGGGWLTIGGAAVDWIYRDLDRVERSWQDAAAGRVSFHSQVGHPAGVTSVAYAGELALAVVLADPDGTLGRLRGQMADYPPALADALAAGLWEARFSIDIAKKGAAHGDAAYVSGCLFRAVMLCAHALHGRAGRWLVNEKGAVASAGRLPIAPDHFADRAHALLGAPGTDSAALLATLGAAARLVDDTVAAVA
ncbi:nucleotidyltransferase domain-containing protein [Microbacteriaceae bacterium 4G12]